MATNKTFKPIDTAFAILFMLLLAITVLHVTTVSDMGGQDSAIALRLTPALERFRTLERDLSLSTEHLRDTSMDPETKAILLNTELGRIERALAELGGSGLKVSGLTRLAEPHMHIRFVREKILSREQGLGTILAVGGQLDRALEATLFVVRGNIVRLGEELADATESMNGLNNRARQIAIFGGLAAVLVFAPVRFMAARAAAKPMRALNAATRAIAEEKWDASGLDYDGEDAVGELVGAFRDMAAKLRESREQRADAYRRTLASLVQAIEAKDTFTSNHSCNVAKYAEMLAAAVGLSESEINDIADGGLLHDIGKIGIPDEIINKPGKLTPREFSIIQEHPVIGHRIVKPLDGSEALLAPVRHHHERWDGTGYPDGLRAEKIPIVARIISVADMFEALTSGRPYRKRMSVDRAVAVLQSESGRTLDPALADKFIAEVLPKIRRMLADPPADTTLNASQTDSRIPVKPAQKVDAL